MFWILNHRFIAPIIITILLSGPAVAEIIRVETNTSLKAVYLIEDTDSDQILVNPVFMAGEVDFDGPQGLSHYLEHLMFWHADEAGGKKIHGREGNAWVNGIVTSYFNKGILAETDDLFDFARRLLALPQLDTQFMLDEKRVVEREYDYRLSENPDRRLIEKMQSVLFAEHPAGRSVIGTPESIRSLTLDHAFGFHKKYYHPANLVLIISGNLNENQARAYVEKAFGNIVAGTTNNGGWRSAGPAGDLDTKIEIRADNLESVAYKYNALSPWAGSRDRLQDSYTVWMTTRILNSTLEGSLAKPLRLDNFIASGLSANLDGLVRGQIRLLFQARPDEGVELGELADKFKAALKSVVLRGVPSKTIVRVKKRLLREAERRAQEPRYLIGRSFIMLRLGLEPNSSTDHIARIKAVNKQDIDELLRAVASPDRKVDGYLRKGNK